MIRAVNPYLNFEGNTEEAFEFYRSVFGGEFAGLIRFRDFPGNPMGVPDEELDRIAHMALPLGEGNLLMGTDIICAWADDFKMGNHSHIHLDVASAGEAERLFGALGEGGHATMPLQRTEWAELYGNLVDRFGVQWMVSYTGSVVFTG
jgi:PhnB protein